MRWLPVDVHEQPEPTTLPRLVARTASVSYEDGWLVIAGPLPDGRVGVIGRYEGVTPDGVDLNGYARTWTLPDGGRLLQARSAGCSCHTHPGLAAFWPDLAGELLRG